MALITSAENTMKAVLTALFVSTAAHAAGVPPDTVFGLRVGEAVRLPACDQAGGILRRREGGCLDDAAALTAGWTGHTFVNFLGVEIPSWVAGSKVHVEIVDGVLEQIRASTRGVLEQQLVFADLSTKFGKPTAATVETMKTLAGEFSYIDASWTFSPYQVRFAGASGNLREGTLVVGTEKGLAAGKQRLEQLLNRPNGL